MSKSMTLRLDEFGRQALADFAEERHDSASVVVRTASLYYLADRESGRSAWRVPSFLEAGPPGADRLEVDLDDETWLALAEEARGQGVEPSRLAEHALLYFFADVDGGRLTERLGGAMEERRKAPSKARNLRGS
jgi:GNAT superfamily N-acetyltransferase